MWKVLTAPRPRFYNDWKWINKPKLTPLKRGAEMEWTEFPPRIFHDMSVYERLLTQEGVQGVYIRLRKDKRLIQVAATTASSGLQILAERSLQEEQFLYGTTYPGLFADIGYAVGDAVNAYHKLCTPDDPVKEEMREALKAAHKALRGIKHSSTLLQIENALKKSEIERRDQ